MVSHWECDCVLPGDGSQDRNNEDVLEETGAFQLSSPRLACQHQLSLKTRQTELATSDQPAPLTVFIGSVLCKR